MGLAYSPSPRKPGDAVPDGGPLLAVPFGQVIGVSMVARSHKICTYEYRGLAGGQSANAGVHAVAQPGPIRPI